MAVLSYLSPAAGGGKIYAKKLVAAVLVVYQRDYHILFCRGNAHKCILYEMSIKAKRGALTAALQVLKMRNGGKRLERCCIFLAIV